MTMPSLRNILIIAVFAIIGISFILVYYFRSGKECFPGLIGFENLRVFDNKHMVIREIEKLDNGNPDITLLEGECIFIGESMQEMCGRQKTGKVHFVDGCLVTKNISINNLK